MAHCPRTSTAKYSRKHGGDGEEQQRRLAVAESLQNARVRVVAHGADESRADDKQIDLRLRVVGRVHAQKRKDRVAQQQKQHRRRNGGEHDDGVERVDRVAHLFELARAEILRDDDRAARRKPHKECNNEECHGEARTDGGKRTVADVVADHPAVYHVVELLQDAAGEHREGKKNQMPRNAALGHVAHTGIAHRKTFFFSHSERASRGNGRCP